VNLKELCAWEIDQTLDEHKEEKRWLLDGLERIKQHELHRPSKAVAKTFLKSQSKHKRKKKKVTRKQCPYHAHTLYSYSTVPILQITLKEQLSISNIQTEITAASAGMKDIW
jgi:hypothetical protein